MSKEKGTLEIFNLNYDVFLVMVEERFNDKITSGDIYQIVNRSYGISKNSNINMNKYVSELAKRAKELKESNSILYAFFDIKLEIITKKIINNGGANEIMDEMIRNRMCILTGNKMQSEHKNEN